MVVGASAVDESRDSFALSVESQPRPPWLLLFLNESPEFVQFEVGDEQLGQAICS